MAKPENPIAFPASADGYGNFLKGTPGMTLRDWFAGQAMIGLLASTNYDKNPSGYTGDAAHDAFVIADAMLAERSKA